MREPGILKRAAKPFGFAAALVLVFMMLFTTFAVAMRQLFDLPVLGVVDVMELSLVAMIFIAMPGVFLRDENVTVDVIDHFVSLKARMALRLGGLALALAFLLTMTISMLPQAADKWAYGEVTMTLSIHRFIHWLPILFGFALSVAATLWVMIHSLRRKAPTDRAPDG